ncbi:hypothetical protein GCM10007304_09580 [Rhodococcoides trifolii]|uniref:Uncharacterized protein n=1 Tax=Rhodococcoides trifolii TaxID=908250 RepID=A0A917CTY9_9NOCA|nr:hypothetical protein [Rhodococcus trifolii]GGF97734.1 hypothetical protein GCM10007304_09580 [Rhodococcus trifolii]
MEWWGWLILVLVIIAVIVGAVLAIQAKRRSGGVIIADTSNVEKPGGQAGGRSGMGGAS